MHSFDGAGLLTRTETQSPAGELHLSLYEYDAMGRLDRHRSRDPAGKERIVETCTYDDAGHKTKTHFVDSAPPQPMSWGIEGSKVFYSAPGAAKMTTVYNDAGRPAEVLFHDASGELISRIDFLYDEAGHLVEEIQTRAQFPFPNVDELPPDQREAVRAILGGPFTRFVHRYNEAGLRIETVSSLFGSLGKGREFFAFNDHGDLASQISENESREYGFSDLEGMVDRPGRQERSVARFLYEYDARGNWTSKITEAGHGDHPDFSVSSTELRALTYFDPI
jgi:hypothetical protein